MKVERLTCPRCKESWSGAWSPTRKTRACKWCGHRWSVREEARQRDDDESGGEVENRA